MIKIASVASLVLALATTSPAFAGAFGIEMGAKPEAMGGKLDPRINQGGFVPGYNLDTPPKPNSEFTNYVLYATESTGVCKITAFGRGHQGDINGASIRSTIAELSAVLTEKYGASQTSDFLKSGSVWHDPEDFAMALKQKERVLASYWMAQTKATLPADIRTIALEARGLSQNETYLILTYEFANFGTCMELENKNKNAGL